MAVEEPFEELELVLLEPLVLPAPPAPKMVVVPMVLVIVSLPEISVDTMGRVVIAELPPAPPAPPVWLAVPVLVPVSVPDPELVVAAPLALPVPVDEEPAAPVAAVTSALAVPSGNTSLS